MQCSTGLILPPPNRVADSTSTTASSSRQALQGCQGQRRKRVPEVVGVVVNVGAPDDLLAVREIAVLTGSGTVFLELGAHLFKSMGELVKAEQNNSIIVASNLKFSMSVLPHFIDCNETSLSFIYEPHLHGLGSLEGIRRSLNDIHSIHVRDDVKNVIFYRAKHDPLTLERVKLKDEVEARCMTCQLTMQWMWRSK